MAADGISQREIAARLRINRRTVRRMLESDEPQQYRRTPQGSMLDPLSAGIDSRMCAIRTSGWRANDTAGRFPMDDLQQRAGVVARAVLLCRHCDSEPTEALARVGDHG